MSQTSIVAGCLVLAFFVFITTRGELPAYGSLFKRSGAAPNSAAIPGTNNTAWNPASVLSSGQANSIMQKFGLSSLSSIFTSSNPGNTAGFAGTSQTGASIYQPPFTPLQ